MSMDDVPTDNKIRFFQWSGNDPTGLGVKYAICLSFRTSIRGIQICSGKTGGSAIRCADTGGWGDWQKIQ